MKNINLIGWLRNWFYTKEEIDLLLQNHQPSTPVVSKILLTADKQVLSHYDNESCTLTATLLDSNSNGVSGEEIIFKANGGLLGTVITGDNGVAQCTYQSTGVGDVTITAECMNLLETYSIQDCSYYNTTEVTRSSTNGSTIYDNNLSQSLPSKCEISFDLYSDSSSDTGEHRFFLLPKSQYNSGTTQPTNAIYVDAYNTKMNIGKRESSTVGLYTNLAYGSGSYRNFKIIKDGTELTFYIDDNLIGRSTISWIDNYSNYCLSMMRWNTRGTSMMKNVKFKPL